MIRRAALFAIATSLLVACNSEAPQPHDGDAREIVSLDQSLEQRFERESEFRQVGLLFDSAGERFEYRVDGGTWRPIEVTWSEGVHHVGRVLLDAPASVIDLRADRPWSFGQVQFYDQIHATDRLASDLPVLEPRAGAINALAPADMVISRSDWGARDPNKVCGSPHNPYRIAIHHTASPDNDGGDAAARMRQMQAYHIDSNGWCDIGYHFVVSQAGDIYQGRSNEERTGAHVGGQNSGNIGVSLIGNFQEQTVGTAQFNATAEIVGWAARTYDVPFNRNSIKGHREHDGQSTSCPGDNMLSRLDELIDVAASGGAPDNGWETGFEVNWLGEPTDLYPAGTSVGKPDLFAGDTIQAEILITNTTTSPMRNVLVDYWFESPFLSGTKYTIETDAPEFDRATWVANDADENPDNPAKDAMGESGTLGLYSMAAGETKRVVIDLAAAGYSLGMADHPDVRAWLRQADGIYGDQTAFDQDPTTANSFDGLMQGFAELDVLSRNEWQFDAGEAEQLEGWTGCAGVTPSVDVEAGALTAEFDAADCIESPAWTLVDADVFDQMIVRMSVPTQGESVIYWGAEGEAYSELRAYSFMVSPERSTYMIPIGDHEEWAGEVQRLRIMPLADAEGTVAIDAIFFQSSDGTVGSDREEHVDEEPVEPGTGTPDLDGKLGFDNLDPQDIRVNEGCSTTSAAESPAALLLLALIFGIRRRR